MYLRQPSTITQITPTTRWPSFSGWNRSWVGVRSTKGGEEKVSAGRRKIYHFEVCGSFFRWVFPTRIRFVSEVDETRCTPNFWLTPFVHGDWQRFSHFILSAHSLCLLTSVGYTHHPSCFPCPFPWGKIVHLGMTHSLWIFPHTTTPLLPISYQRGSQVAVLG